MAVKKRVIKNKRVSLRSSLTLTEIKSLSDGFYGYINKIDKLLDKKLAPQLKLDLIKLKNAISKQAYFLRKF
ncbi:MAG: hypothetical protein LC105_05400 [Chitinophagales bacterium]|nr:hypothetical protein [Chitinophagales bacterium]